MIARQASWRMQGVDLDTALTDTLQSAAGRLIFSSSDAKFVVRYLGDVTEAEVEAVFAANLLLSLVQHPRTGPISGVYGSADGLHAATLARALGFPAGATVWCDLESWEALPADACAYVNEWSASVTAAGYEAGLYVGWAKNQLSPAALAGLASTAYWKGCSAGIPEPLGIGWQMLQAVPGDQNLGPLEVDWDVVWKDFKGRMPTFAAGQ